MAGIDHRAKILQLRVLNSVNSGDMDWLMDALYYVAQRNDVDIVNMSLINFAPTPMLADALSAAADHSILVACAGNSGPGTADDRYPAAHPAVIAVSWTTATDTLATGASTGLSVDISAPGMDLSVAHASPPFLPSQFDVVRGCSIATPLVTGIGGLVKSIYPGLNRGRFLQILAASAQDLGPPGWDPEFGWGRVNAARALDYTILAYQLFHDGFETGDTSAWPVTVP
ncbi:MAG: S8 family serine peptidase [Thermoanaerobaculia bacterium]